MTSSCKAKMRRRGFFKMELLKNKTYEKILEHRRKCKKWGNDFCLDCFGGGITKYTENIILEGIVKEISK